MIKVEGLTKRYGPTVAVRNISFEVEKGEIVGFLGPNGAGKTTTMRILTCFLPPTEGTATVAGYDVLDNPLEVKKRIGYLLGIEPRRRLIKNQHIGIVDQRLRQTDPLPRAL